MRFEYDSNPIRGAVIMAAVLVIIALLLPDTLLRLVCLSVVVGPAAWAYVQWRRRGRGVQFNERELVVEYALMGRTRRIPYVDVLASGSTTNGGLIVAYLRRIQQSNTADYPAISHIALAQARPAVGIRRSIVSTPGLKDIQGCLAELSQHQEQIPPGLAQQLTEAKLRSLAGRKNVRNIILLLLAVFATPIYVIVISRLIRIFH